jgi:hypothetical protein
LTPSKAHKGLLPDKFGNNLGQTLTLLQSIERHHAKQWPMPKGETSILLYSDFLAPGTKWNLALFLDTRHSTRMFGELASGRTVTDGYGRLWKAIEGSNLNLANAVFAPFRSKCLFALVL